MICVYCNTEFKGGRIYISGERGPWRKCPNGHRFKEPQKPRYKTRHERIVFAVESRCAQVIAHGVYHPEYTKACADILRMIDETSNAGVTGAEPKAERPR
jgi:hypothetical protein